MASTPRLPDVFNISAATAGAHLCTWATDKDWTKHRVLIKELYSSHTLKETMKFMETEHKFKATSVVHSDGFYVTSLIYDRNKMYKRRIKQWGLDKNNKDDDMRFIVHKTKARLDQGKQSKI